MEKETKIINWEQDFLYTTEQYQLLTHWHTTFYNTWRTYIYIYIYIYMERLFLMFLDHTQRRSKVGRTPLDE